MEWPLQDTGVFAVPMCVQCCTYTPPDLYEIASTNASGYIMVGTPGWDGMAGVLYRTVTWSGGFQIRYSSEGDCSDLVSTSTVTYSGTSTRNLSDFVTSTGTVTGTIDGSVFAEAEATSPGLALPSISPEGIANSQTQTTDSWSGNGECVGGYMYMERTTGTGTATLSNVCTEEISLAYRSELSPGWEDFSEYPMDASWDYVATASYQPATPGVEGSYEWLRMKYRRTKGGFIPGAEYVCTMEVYRTVFGAGDWALYATLEETLTADATGTLIWEDEIPFARGYSTWVKARSFSAIPA